jgi:hypothetical protein
MQVIGTDVAPLRDAFNGVAVQARIIALLSPT